MTLLLMLLLKSFFVLALSGAALLCLRRASASARHLVCLLTLSALLALPLFSWTLPGWQVAGLFLSKPEAATLVYKAPTPPRSSTTLPKREGAEYSAAANAVHGIPAGATFSDLRHSSSSRFGRTPAKQGGGFLAFYILGVMLAAFRPLIGLWGIAHLRRACTPVTDAPTLSIAADCAAALRLMRLPQTCRADVPVPMTWGGRRPVVVLPCGSKDWPEDRLRSVLLHEMAHVKRRDWTCHRLADLACAVYWFHPLVWLTARRLRAESEIACDDLVLSSGIAAPDYARHLLDIARALPPASRSPHPAAIAMAQTSRIEGRILMVLDTTHRRTTPRRFLLLAAVTGAAALVPLSMLQPAVEARIVSQPLKSPLDASVQMIGVRDINIHHTDQRWWQADSSLLIGTEPRLGLSRRFQKDLFSSTNVKNLMFAFHLSAYHQGEDVTFAPAGSQISMYQADLRSSIWHLETTFPLPQKTTTIGVGIATRPWTIVAAHTPVRKGNASVPSAYGTMVFSSIQRYPESNWFVTVTTNQPQQGQPSQDWRVVAVDAQGRRFFPVSLGPGGTSTQLRLMAGFNGSVSPRRIRQFQVETRPYQWTEFKDVALQPVKP